VSAKVGEGDETGCIERWGGGEDATVDQEGGESDKLLTEGRGGHYGIYSTRTEQTEKEKAQAKRQSEQTYVER
jgi:hypothetical protein